jgi:choline-sulfatase
MPPPRPNILLILTDQQRFDTIAAHANSFGAVTPGMDSLVRRGVSFENAFCTAPISAPARAALLTGLSPTQAGMYGNLGNPCPPLRNKLLTLGHRLQNHGYQTVYHGKSHLGGNLHEYGFEVAYENSHDPTTCMEAARFWRNRDWIINKRPFFQILSLLDPHDIYFLDPHREIDATLPEWPNRTDTLEDKPWPQRQYQGRHAGWSPRRWAYYRQFYRERVERVDRLIAEALHELVCSGFGNNTWIIFTSDHGDMAGEHGMPFKGPVMYDGVLRVPLVIVPPDPQLLGANRSEGGRRYSPHKSKCLCSHVDLAPTVMQLAGLAPDPALPGRSLLPILDGAATHRHAVYAEWHQIGRMVTPIRTIRTLDWKYNHYLGIGEELYNLAEDPAERHNLAGRPQAASMQQDLKRQLFDYLRESGDDYASLAPTDPNGNPLTEQRAP